MKFHFSSFSDVTDFNLHEAKDSSENDAAETLLNAVALMSYIEECEQGDSTHQTKHFLFPP